MNVMASFLINSKSFFISIYNEIKRFNAFTKVLVLFIFLIYIILIFYNPKYSDIFELNNSIKSRNFKIGILYQIDSHIIFEDNRFLLNTKNKLPNYEYQLIFPKKFQKINLKKFKSNNKKKFKFLLKLENKSKANIKETKTFKLKLIKIL